MLKNLLEILKTKGDLIDISEEKLVSMLNTSREMFSLVFKSCDKNICHSVKEGISKIDMELNSKRAQVREMVYEHLAISGARDLLKSIQFFSIANDIERIGDNVKNLAEVLDYLPEESVASPQYRERFKEMLELTKVMFDRAEKMLASSNEEQATEIIVKYQGVSAVCEGLIKDIVTSKSDSVPKADVRLLMIARYTKRINAHLKNIASALKDPINPIGQ